jgi:hypothetical protein
MAIADRRTWLVIAAERRELDGILKRFGKPSKLDWPAEFGCEVTWRGDRWWLVANGPGKHLIERALQQKMEVNGIINTGFCGGLDPSLRVGDIVVWGNPPGSIEAHFTSGEIVTADRVAVTATEKAILRATSGAVAVDMEAAAVSQKAREWGVPFYCIRAVSDTAFDDMPLDFNLYRDSEGRFSRTRIALAALAQPVQRVPALLRLDRNCRIAAEALGETFAGCRF